MYFRNTIPSDGFFKIECCVRTHVIDINQNTVKKGKKGV